MKLIDFLSFHQDVVLNVVPVNHLNFIISESLQNYLNDHPIVNEFLQPYRIIVLRLLSIPSSQLDNFYEYMWSQDSTVQREYFPLVESQLHPHLIDPLVKIVMQYLN